MATLPKPALLALHEALAAVAPIAGISVADWDDRSTWCIEFSELATDEEKAAASQAMSAFDPPPH